MKDLAVDDRPREKLRRLGAAALGDNELVAVVLGNGCRDLDALGVANELLKRHGGLYVLARTTCEELARTLGIGQAKAARMVAAIELGRRTLTRGPGARVRLRTPEEAAHFLLPAFGCRPVEQFGVVLLDTKHRVLKTTLVALGSLNVLGVEPREVFREAVRSSAAAIIVFHNHPSGDPTPSPDDVELTRRLVAAGVLVGISVLDHLVLGDARYCSLRDLRKF